MGEDVFVGFAVWVGGVVSWGVGRGRRGEGGGVPVVDVAVLVEFGV